VAATRQLHIAWLGTAPGETGSAAGVMAELLEGLVARGHAIDCFFPGQPRELTRQLDEYDNLSITWGASSWRWGRWYSRTKFTAFASGLLWRAVAFVQLRRELRKRHRSRPYDLIFQNQTIESFGVPASVAREAPLVIRPDTYLAGELRWLIAERRLALACQPWYLFIATAMVMSVRALVQRVSIRRASLLICISRMLRDNVVRDYRFPVERTVVIHNPVNLDRFTNVDRALSDPPVILVPTRIAVRKGIEDVVSVSKELLARNVRARVRIVGGPSLFSDYTRLLDALPSENSEWAGRIPHLQMQEEFEGCDLVLLPSKFDPCPMAILEALAAGVPVVATSQVGSIEEVDRSVATEVEPGDVDGLVTAVTEMLERLRSHPSEVRGLARAEAERLFAQDAVCEKIAIAFEQVVGDEPVGEPIAVA
jgi:glycosyltransferase involved in cell wall biosynthesis